MLLDVTKFTALAGTIGIGLLAGILVGTGLAAWTAKGLPATSWVLRFQLEDRLFAKVMPPLMIATLIALLTACTLARGASRLLLGMGILCMLLVLLVTIGLEVPLNKQIQLWTVASTPSNWEQVRDIWLQRHLWRTVCAITGFLCVLFALVS